MNRLARPTLVISLFTISGQAVGFLTQVIIAASFGARPDMDAFLSAQTLPQYVISILLSALGFVFIPVFIGYSGGEREDEAWRIASSVITVSSLTLSLLAFAGMAFAKPLLQLTTPGLSATSLDLAARVAAITWPTVVATGIFNLLTGIYQAQGSFGWPSAVPVLGALANLAMVSMLVPPLGITGVAVAATISMAMQVVLLLPIALRPNRFRPLLDFSHPGMRQVLQLLWPLVLSGIIVRCTPIVDRYVASSLGEGAISHLGYAYKLLGLLTVIVSSGIATVAFPRMARETAGGDMVRLRSTVSLALRAMWMMIAPTISIGAVLALPMTKTLFLRGAFTETDADAVATLLRIYLLALAGASLGNIGGRAFYALKDTRTTAVMGAIEALAYAVYTPFLAHLLGTVGVALAYVLYFDLSPAWWLPVLRWKMGNIGGRQVAVSYGRTLVAASLGGAVAWFVMTSSPSTWIQVLGGGLAGLLTYAIALFALRSVEAMFVWSALSSEINVLKSRSVTVK